MYFLCTLFFAPVSYSFFFIHAFTAVNYVAISNALGVQPSVLTAGLAADNVICAIYFTTLFAIGSRVPPEDPTSSDGESASI